MTYYSYFQRFSNAVYIVLYQIENVFDLIRPWHYQQVKKKVDF